MPQRMLMMILSLKNCSSCFGLCRVITIHNYKNDNPQYPQMYYLCN